MYRLQATGLKYRLRRIGSGYRTKTTGFDVPVSSFRLCLAIINNAQLSRVNLYAFSRTCYTAKDYVTLKHF